MRQCAKRHWTHRCAWDASLRHGMLAFATQATSSCANSRVPNFTAPLYCSCQLLIVFKRVCSICTAHPPAQRCHHRLHCIILANDALLQHRTLRESNSSSSKGTNNQTASPAFVHLGKGAWRHWVLTHVPPCTNHTGCLHASFQSCWRSGMQLKRKCALQPTASQDNRPCGANLPGAPALSSHPL